METMSMIVHLPQYLMVGNNYRGKVRLMEVLSALYDFPLAEEVPGPATEAMQKVAQKGKMVIVLPFFEKDLRRGLRGDANGWGRAGSSALRLLSRS